MRSSLTYAAVVTALGLCLGGCAAGGRITPAGAELVADDGSAAFLDRVSSQPTVSENDAMRGLLMLLEGQDTAADFPQRVHLLRVRNIVSADWDFVADRPVTKGKVAYMIFRAAKVPGGLVLTLAGPSQRYCLRELQYRGMMAPGAVLTPVTGSEFVAVLARADEYRRTGKVPPIMETAGQP